MFFNLTDPYELRQSPPVLLSDELVRQFIVEGYLMLQPSALPTSFHNNLYARVPLFAILCGACGPPSSLTPPFSLPNGGWQVDALNSKWKDNVGNNILPTIPELDLVFEDPTVRGAANDVRLLSSQSPLLALTFYLGSPGALQSVLGQGYMMHAHRHCHDRYVRSPSLSYRRLAWL